MICSKVVDQIPACGFRAQVLNTDGCQVSVINDQAAQLYSMAILVERPRSCANSSTGDSRRTQ